MKSFVHEAKNVETAIFQAWCTAGYPIKFSVKILDAGNISWLWWKHKNAKIIFSYDLTNQELNDLSTNVGQKYKNQQNIDQSALIEKPTYKKKVQQKYNETSGNERQSVPHLQPVARQNQDSNASRDLRNRLGQQTRHNAFPERVASQSFDSGQQDYSHEINEWDQDSIKFACDWLKKITSDFNVESSILSVTQKAGTLTIHMAKTSLMDEVREKQVLPKRQERLLFTWQRLL